ncbi:hypothetical protein J4401_06080 [Candidatus Woesearchaeota archaeon]|nr:hypothetical protein [Candidatus Woesearchaeota archaeon]
MKATQQKKKQEVNVFSLSSMATFKGFIKNGLDSSTLINIIVCFDSNFDEYRKRGFTFTSNFFYYHEISRSEVIGVLINKHNFQVDEAKNSFNKLEKEFNMTKIIRNDATDASYEQIAREANDRVIKTENNPKLRICDQDIIIIGGFLRDTVNFVHTGDVAFQKTCTELKLNLVPLPERDIKKEEEIKKWMKKKSS